MAEEADDPMRPPDRLPTDPLERTAALVGRSRPSSAQRPRLSDPELEAKLVSAEQTRAVELAEREDLFDRVSRVTELVDESEEGVISIEIDDEDSLVHHVENLRG